MVPVVNLKYAKHRFIKTLNVTILINNSSLPLSALHILLFVYLFVCFVQTNRNSGAMIVT